jgi:hypothetical protein
MKTCSSSCQPACDYCVSYKLHGQDYADDDGRVWKGMLYVGLGMCNLHHRPQEPHDSCPDFTCTLAKAD